MHPSAETPFIFDSKHECGAGWSAMNLLAASVWNLYIALHTANPRTGINAGLVQHRRQESAENTRKNGSNKALI